MGYLKIISAILLWSSLGIFVRKSGLPVAALVFYPSLTAAFVQFILLSATGQIKDVIRPGNNPNGFFPLALLPFCSLANTLLFYFAFTNTTIANAVLTHYTAPVFVALLAPFFLKENIRKKTWIAIMLSSLGLWLILGLSSSGGVMPLRDGEKSGILAGALSGGAYALIILILRKISSGYRPLFITLIQNSIMSLMLLPFVLNMPFSLNALPYVLTMGIVHSTIAPLLYVQGFKDVRANEAAILGYFEPVGAIILSFFFLHETPAVQALLGGALILYSGYMIIMAREK